MKAVNLMQVSVSRTPHISFKQNESYMLTREQYLCKKLHKNRSDLYKYAMNALYRDVKLAEEDGKEILCY